MRVLVVEDESRLAASLRTELEAEGFAPLLGQAASALSIAEAFGLHVHGSRI